jgi:hypothetical protein
MGILPHWPRYSGALKMSTPAKVASRPSSAPRTKLRPAGEQRRVGERSKRAEGWGAPAVRGRGQGLQRREKVCKQAGPTSQHGSRSNNKQL